MTEDPRVAVVVVSFEAREELLACLDSLRGAGQAALEIVVVDNASSDGSVDAVRARHGDVRVLANARNVGFGRACNQGLGATRAPFVLFLNPDAELIAEGSVGALAAHLEERRDVGVVAPLIRHPDGTVSVSTGPDLTPLAEWRQRRLVLGVKRRDPRILREVARRHSVEHEPHWVSGAALMARREALETVGGFDERYFLYEEDADLCRRLRHRGWRVVFTPTVEVRHRGGASMARASRRARLEYHRSHLLYYRRHNGPLATAMLRLLLLARAVGQLAAALVRGDASRAAEARAVFALAWAWR